MADRPGNKIAARDAEEVCSKFTLSDEAGVLPRAGLSPLAFADSLAAAGLFADALTFLAYALPKPEAVRWACLCTREAVGDSPTPEAAAALKAAETWAADPVEANRRPTLAAAEAVGLGHPAGAAAVAAFASGGSVAPPGLPDVPPGGHHTAHAVSCATQMAATLVKPGPSPEVYNRFVELGVGVAEGKPGLEKTAR